MKEPGFGEKEFSPLKDASIHSSNLIVREDQAMKTSKEARIVDGFFQSHPFEITDKFALRIVFDESYHSEVEKIMVPVTRFFTELDQRIAAVKAAEQKAVFWKIYFPCHAMRYDSFISPAGILYQDKGA